MIVEIDIKVALFVNFYEITPLCLHRTVKSVFILPLFCPPRFCILPFLRFKRWSYLLLTHIRGIADDDVKAAFLIKNLGKVNLPEEIIFRGLLTDILKDLLKPLPFLFQVLDPFLYPLLLLFEEIFLFWSDFYQFHLLNRATNLPDLPL